ncbi:hypothetical protein SY83_10985 [Paenibacillus swuensis]|uniref:Uncharacterized protein n=2 Tax=Paenibacillus swuensis TaxID=1178515 RepID=A0A172TPM6_9BACL|nr:hypothetical protein SY83_10985 [Paenibacillus swuensis]
MKQERATQDFDIQPAEITIESPRGELHIDQSRAWEALNGGVIESFNHRIYSNNKQLALDGIANIVSKGNRMAAIHLRTNVIADLGFESYFEDYYMNIFGEASYDNIDIHYTAHKPVINYNPGVTDTQTIANKAEFSYVSGKLNIYMLQFPSIEIIPPNLDMRM